MSNAKTKPSPEVDAPAAEATTELGNNVSKLTVKSMGLKGVQAALLNTIGEKVWLGRIYGMASDVREKKRQGDSGELLIDYPIMGTFEGVNYATGEVYNSAVLYLPGGFHEQLRQVLKDAKGDINVAFALEIGAEKSTCKAGFEWVAKMIQKPDVADPLAGMRSKIAATPRSKSAPLQIEGTKTA